jgi:hypothetical protein
VSDEPQDQDQHEGETLAQKIARQAKERDAAAQSTDLTGQPRDLEKEGSDRISNGAGSKEPLGRVVKEEEHPGPQATDGSRSPHDVSSEGGNRQAAAHKQVFEAEQRAAEAEALARGATDGKSVTPTAEQAESGRVAREEGRAE